LSGFTPEYKLIGRQNTQTMLTSLGWSDEEIGERKRSDVFGGIEVT
jgi:hypothetical protein